MHKPGTVASSPVCILITGPLSVLQSLADTVVAAI